jgi:hypothetical protein
MLIVLFCYLKKGYFSKNRYYFKISLIIVVGGSLLSFKLFRLGQPISLDLEFSNDKIEDLEIKDPSSLTGAEIFLLSMKPKLGPIHTAQVSRVILKLYNRRPIEFPASLIFCTHFCFFVS